MHYTPTPSAITVAQHNTHKMHSYARGYDVELLRVSGYNEVRGHEIADDLAGSGAAPHGGPRTSCENIFSTCYGIVPTVEVEK